MIQPEISQPVVSVQSSTYCTVGVKNPVTTPKLSQASEAKNKNGEDTKHTCRELAKYFPRSTGITCDHNDDMNHCKWMHDGVAHKSGKWNSF